MPDAVDRAPGRVPAAPATPGSAVVQLGGLEASPGSVPPGDQPLGRPPEEGWAEPDVEGDWLDRICPYLLSEDGTYRSSEPDPGHRCTAQDPPSTLPTAFQERYCLSERHVRCEMYKVARAARSVALGQGGIPDDQLRTARFKPSVRSVPLAFGPALGGQGGTGTRSRRPVIIAAIAIGALAVLIFALVLLLSGGGGPGPATGASPSPSVGVLAPATGPPSATATPAAEATDDDTSDASSEATPDAPSSPAASAAPPAEQLILYEVQEGEALIAIAEAFGTSRRAILVANPDIVDRQPHTQPGDVIIVPVAASMSVEEIEATPGFRRFVE